MKECIKNYLAEYYTTLGELTQDACWLANVSLDALSAEKRWKRDCILSSDMIIVSDFVAAAPETDVRTTTVRGT